MAPIINAAMRPVTSLPVPSPQRSAAGQPGYGHRHFRGAHVQHGLVTDRALPGFDAFMLVHPTSLLRAEQSPRMSYKFDLYFAAYQSGDAL